MDSRQPKHCIRNKPVIYRIMEHLITYQGKPLCYQTAGSGPTLLLLHGFTESSAIWKDFTTELSPEFTVVAPDLPGHGKTAVFDPVHSMKFMADSVKALLDHLGIRHCVVVGHSMGGYVALALAKAYPDLVKGISLFHSHAGADTEEGKQNRLRTIRIVEENKAGFIRNFIPELFDPAHVHNYTTAVEALKTEAAAGPSQGISAALRGMMERDDNRPFLQETTIPVLFIAGKADSKIPVALILEQAALPRHAEVLLLENTGHMGFIEAPTQTVNTIRCFAEKILLK